MKNALVTGANGFVGTAICRELVNQGINVIAVVRNEKSNIDGIANLKGISIVYCDMSNYGCLADMIDYSVDTVFHLAWEGTSGPLRGNQAVQIDNVKHTCDMVEAAGKMGCKKFVFASTIMEYEVEAVMASDITPGINTLYSSAKVSANYMARTLAGSLGIDYVRAVISNIYGPGELSPRLINTSIRKLLNGEHCSFSSGEQMYDFVYVDDAARAFVGLGGAGKANKTYYIGSMNPRPLKEFLLEMRDQIDTSIELGLGDFEFNGVTLTYKEFDVEAVYKDTGIKPEISFTVGIRNTANWIKENN